MNKTITLIILIVSSIFGIRVPDKAIIIKESGLVVEPSTLIFHNDQQIFLSIGVRLSMIIDPLRVDYKKHGCQIGDPQKKTIWEEVSGEVNNYFNHLPQSFNSIQGHYCHSDEIDCMLAEDNWTEDFEKFSENEGPERFHKKRTVHYSIQDVTREKRQVVAASLLVGGITAAAMGLYSFFSNENLKKHIESVEKTIREDEYELFSLKQGQSQYIKKTNSLFLKTYQGFMNNEKHLLDLLCNATTKSDIETTVLEYTIMLNSYKNSINRAMDGQVTDFLITTELLDLLIETRPELADSAYEVDPGLFYLVSTSMLTHIDRNHHTVYFLITIPLLHQEDISPLYTIHNLGWYQDGAKLSFQLPPTFHYLTDRAKGKKVLAYTDTSTCLKKKGSYICEIQSASVDSQTLCLQHLIHSNSSESCKIKISKESPRCSVNVLRSGICTLGCPEVSTSRDIRGIVNWVKIQLDINTISCFSYSSFQSLNINGKHYKTRETIMKSRNKKPTIIQNIELDMVKDFLIPGFAQDLEELQAIANKTTKHMVRTIIGKVSHIPRVYILILGSVVLILVILIWALFKRGKRGQLAKIKFSELALRDGRGLNY